MAYYLGRDVKVYLTTESPEAQVDVSSFAVSAISAGGSSVAAVATLTITDTNVLQGRNIIITTTDGTTVTALETDTTTTTDTNTPTFEAPSGSSTGSKREAAAANIATCLNANSKLTATSSTYVVTITQATAGVDGNTNLAGTAEGSGATFTTDFTGGEADPNFSAATTFAENLDQTSISLTRLADLTGVDIGIGVTDEDITFMSTKTVLKAEIKKETTITLTRKKTNSVWDVVYNGPTAANEGWTGSAQETGDYGARWGVIEGAAQTWYIMNGLSAPKNVTDFGGSNVSFGYRVFIELKSTEEIIAIPGCQLVAHSVTLNADGTTEETCELISQVTPKIGSTLAAVSGRLTASDM